MKRRTFLQASGLALPGAAAALAADSERAAAKPVLITSAQTRFAQMLAAGLAAQYRPILTARQEVRTEYELRRGDLLDEKAMPDLVRGIDAIVHLAEPPENASVAEQVDVRTRGTYNLLRAAAAAGVTRAVYVGSLEVMRGYDKRFAVTEDWRPQPGTAAGAMSHSLGEFTCREFAREGSMGVVVLRFGRLVGAEEAAGKRLDCPWLAESDAVQAVRLALDYLQKRTSPADRWAVFHILSDGCPRFPVAKAKRLLGYQPEFRA